MAYQQEQEQYLIGEHNPAAFFGAQEDALLAFEGRQLRVDLFNVVHQNKFGLGARRLVVEFQPVGVETGVSSLPGRSERSTQFLDVPVKDTIGIYTKGRRRRRRQ